MSKIPTIEEFFNIEKIKKLNTGQGLLKISQDLAVEFAKIHVEAALKSVNDNVIINDYNIHEEYCPHVDENSILNAYPLENIK